MNNQEMTIFVDHIFSIITIENSAFNYEDTEWTFCFVTHPSNIILYKYKAFHFIEHSSLPEMREIARRLSIRFVSQFEKFEIDKIVGHYMFFYINLK